MNQASITSKSFRPARRNELLTLIREIFAATPLGIVLNALRARTTQPRGR